MTGLIAKNLQNSHMLSKFYYFIFVNSLTLFILAARLNCSHITFFNRNLLNCFKISIAPFHPLSSPDTLDWVASLWSRGGRA